MLLLFLVLGAFATDPPTIPTPYPTITPAPKSTCVYQDDDQGPFALDCLQAAFINAGCRAVGESYPTETGLDSDDGESSDTDGLKRDKVWYNQQSWKGVQDALVLVLANGGHDCRGTPTMNPTPGPTADPTSRRPTAPPTPRPTAETPAPVYSQDDEEGWRQNLGSAATGGEITNAALKAKCEPIFGRQYDDTKYVIVVTVGGASSYYTTEGEVCDLFQDGQRAEATTLVGNRVGGPFQTLGSLTRADGTAQFDWATASASDQTDVYVTARRVNTACREQVAPWSSDFTVDLSNSFCGAARSSASCGGGDANQREIALGLANRLFESCQSTEVFKTDGTGGYTYNAGSDCWNDGAGTEPAYVAEMRGQLCTERCSLTDQIYFPSTESCWAKTAAGDASSGGAACQAAGSNAASVNSKAENGQASQMCAGDDCYLGSVNFGTAGATWADGKGVDFVYFKDDSETAAGFVAGSATQVHQAADARWNYSDGSGSHPTLCRSDSNEDDTTRHRDIAQTCSINPGGDSQENYQTLEASFPTLNQDRSGFRDSSSPGVLSVGIDVPKELYEVQISFENSTNDDGEYTDFRDDARWAVTHDADCTTDATYTLSVPWTVFNLGGAGGVSRLVNYKNEAGEEKTPLSEEATDGSGRKFIFGATVKVTALQPLEVKLDARTTDSNPLNQARQALWDRRVTVMLPIIITFQKTVTVSTQTDIISTKFNYKTVAALIQSIQYETQYFNPPYAKIKLRIRTKSQYPYMFHDDVARHHVSVGSISDDSANAVDTVLSHLANDANCTFTNPDHMREGDICVQEWQLDITPRENVCYATGEYSIQYETRCFFGKDVCYMPVDDTGAELTSVSFTFKIQTSKFCPTVADEIELGGSLEITGRESFKPDQESPAVEGPTVGDWYLQGERIHVLGRTTSERAKIIHTEVLMVEVHQELDGLIQTGFNRVPFDPNTGEVVVWTPEVQAASGATRLADGEVTVVADGVTDQVRIIEDSEVYPSGHDFGDFSFTAQEAGLIVLLHARVFPVNTDSFATKKLVVTLQVQYEAIGTGGGRRRRLMTNDKYLDSQSEVSMGVRSWAPKSKLPSGLKGVASMAMTMSIQNGHVSRGNAQQFAQSWHNAVVTGLNRNLKGKFIYSEQVSVDALWSGDNKIWMRSAHQGFDDNRRRILGGAQKLKIEFTFADVLYKNSMPLFELIELFEQQLKLPASPLMSQPVFRTSVIHDLKSIETSDYVPALNPEHDVEQSAKLASSAMIATPFVALLSLILALW